MSEELEKDSEAPAEEKTQEEILKEQLAEKEKELASFKKMQSDKDAYISRMRKQVSAFEAAALEKTKVIENLKAEFGKASSDTLAQETIKHKVIATQAEIEQLEYEKNRAIVESSLPEFESLKKDLMAFVEEKGTPEEVVLFKTKPYSIPVDGLRNLVELYNKEKKEVTKVSDEKEKKQPESEKKAEAPAPRVTGSMSTKGSAGGSAPEYTDEELLSLSEETLNAMVASFDEKKKKK